MDRLEFIGIQNTSRGNVKVNGYIQILPKKDEFRVPVKGLITIQDKRNLTHDFTGSISQLARGINPNIKLYTSGNLGEKLFYRLKDYAFVKERLIYSGIWCPVKGNMDTITMPFDTPKNSKKVSLEFALKTYEGRLLLKEIGISQ